MKKYYDYEQLSNFIKYELDRHLRNRSIIQFEGSEDFEGNETFEDIAAVLVENIEPGCMPNITLTIMKRPFSANTSLKEIQDWQWNNVLDLDSDMPWLLAILLHTAGQKIGIVFHMRIDNEHEGSFFDSIIE